MEVMRYIKGVDGLQPFKVRGIIYTTNYDVDEYGIQVIPFVATPGDLDFGNNANRLRTEEELRRIVALPPTSQDILANTDLKDLEMKKNNVESPYTHFIHLTKFYRLGYDIIIEKKFLGGRQKGGPIKIKNLHLSCRSKYLRLPTCLDLEVQHLFVRNNRNGISIIRPLLAPHWSSLESITVEKLENRDSEILSSIGTVGVDGLPDWSAELPYRRMKFSQSRFDKLNYILIAKNLKVAQPSVGAHYTFIIWEAGLEEVMEMMKADDDFENGQLQASKVTKYQECFILRINNHSEVLIYFSFNPTRNYASFRYTLEMEVQPRVETLRN
ncbi:hypothetical protein GCK72_007721 [Caenorhabditis remanei]|uniref:Uncharacterized protein n=1 Tax=Caenorhabditis remanei TaxID=31234 RepID=A0A6A5HPM2_CAERE|nr:hypothetical protein GCK72_007721 [Caenorhabditis remanei]KAF1767762.1 hypothetical protein GCK72_007721 [Caenorhabditis remanei]